MINKTVSEALKLVPADTELFAAWDYENGNDWIVGWNEDTDGWDSETGEYIKYCGISTHIVATFRTREEAEDYVTRVYKLDAQLSQSF